MGNKQIVYCILRLSLSLLKAGILFVDYIEYAFAANDFAINTSFFNGCSYFHDNLFIVSI